jgi:phage terminase large subunit-like protein
VLGGTPRRGIVWLTFTPLLGMSEVVHSFDAECGPL